MKATDLQGNLLTSGQYGWGEVNSGKSWNTVTNTWTYDFVWGTITVQFAQTANTLNVNVVTTNFSNSGIIFDGAVIYPFVLHFPALPVGFTDASYEQLAFNTTGPSATLADYGQGEVAAVYPMATKPLYSGFQPAGSANSYTPIISGTALDGMATFYPRNDRPVFRDIPIPIPFLFVLRLPALLLRDWQPMLIMLGRPRGHRLLNGKTGAS